MYIHTNIFLLYNMHKIYCNVVPCTILLCICINLCTLNISTYLGIYVMRYAYVFTYVNKNVFLFCRHIYVDKSVYLLHNMHLCIYIRIQVYSYISI